MNNISALSTEDKATDRPGAIDECGIERCIDRGDFVDISLPVVIHNRLGAGGLNFELFKASPACPPGSFFPHRNIVKKQKHGSTQRCIQGPLGVATPPAGPCGRVWLPSRLRGATNASCSRGPDCCPSCRFQPHGDDLCVSFVFNAVHLMF